MYILLTMILLNLFLLTGTNNVCSTLMEEMFIEKILAEHIFMVFQNFQILHFFFFFFWMGTKRKNKFCKIFIKLFSHNIEMYLWDLWVIYLL